MLELFILIGVIIILGFFASVLFERTRISDILLLMLFGVLVGQVFKLVDLALFASAAPFIGTIALIILLFDGGINLNLMRVLNELSHATLFTFSVFFLTMLACAAFMAAAFSWPIPQGLLFGAVVGGTSSAIVILVVSRLRTPESVKTLLSLESALTDALTIVFTVTIADLIASNAFSASAAGSALLGAFSIAIVLGAIAGVAWSSVLRHFYQRPYGYLLSLAIVFLLYSAAEAFKGSGAIAVLVFGLIVGNAQAFAKRFGSRDDFALDHNFRAFQMEISFFVRTFFFVYIGTLFSLFALPSQVYLVAGVGLMGIILARFIGVELISRMNYAYSEHKLFLNTMMPRGLAAAVLATYPATQGIQIPFFSDAVLAIIVATNIIATLGVYASPQTPDAPNPPAKEYGKPPNPVTPIVPAQLAKPPQVGKYSKQEPHVISNP